MERLKSLWNRLQGSLWFVPSILVLSSVALAIGLIELQPLFERHFAKDWPRLFTAGAEGSRGMLSSIASSMITVAGIVFSMTIVALTLTASQYSPTVLRTFMADRSTQVVLGAFVAVFAYCLLVIRTIRGADEGAFAFVPSIAVLGGVFMAFIGIGLLIYFVHHVATAIHVAYIIERIASATSQTIERQFPAGVVKEPLEPAAGQTRAAPGGHWLKIAAPRTGYVVAIDAVKLLELAADSDSVLRVWPKVGAFVVKGMTVAEVAPGSAPSPDDWRRRVCSCFTLENQRAVHHDAAYGLQQLVDVALKALSPSVHDPTTALTCVDQLGALLRQLSDRRIEGPPRECDGRLRLIVEAPGYADLVRTALASVTHHAASHVEVHARLISAVDCAADATDDPGRLEVLARRLDIHRDRLAQCDLPDEQRDWLHENATALRERLWQRARRALSSPQPAARTEP